MLKKYQWISAFLKSRHTHRVWITVPKQGNPFGISFYKITADEKELT